MSNLPGWLGRLGAELTDLGERLERRRAEAEEGEAEPIEPPVPAPVPATAAAVPDEAARPEAAGGDRVPPPPAYAPSVAARPDPVAAIPWGMRVAAEAGWRLLVLAGTLWVLMRVISAVQLVVLAFVAALLITAMLQPTVARLKRYGLPRGLATAVTAILGFVIIGLVGWFVVWQVMDNIDTLSDKVRTGIDDLKNWLLDSPFHVTEQQINDVAKNLSDTIGTNTEQITSAGLQGVTVMAEVLTGMLLAMFSTLFLLYDGKRIWHWVLKLVPAQARPGVAGAGPRAWRTLTAYVRGTVVVALIDAIFIGLGIWFLKVPMAVPLAVFIFLFAFIPLVGAVISGALAVVVALVTEGVFTALMVLVVVLAVQQIEGHVLQPFILGRAVRVHPLAVVLSVAAGGMIAGIGGAVVAVPLVAVTNTVVGYLRAYGQEEVLRHTPPPRGASALDVAPTPAPGSPPENIDYGDDEDSGDKTAE
ncbi:MULTISPECIES: AI-2E family transporter [unclassified Streptomyces]|uniref:AI-2E family transporter n=1 Tax=unclassified Streptomyces TaxID=2593676 RepID=UPI00224FD8CC|nr:MULTISPECIES: AI-2E family transporter [unclassified Streptomyces]WSP57236.1 AI-2E family transporter [Streptomyces sp. NBC_01241]WSU22046.1 AI-2E family transporter [Streptomyces sp. NBC_01108]MCX4789050.1 AI-2E family transporter [Streptomyces sp. NBC_01221]MCX4795204.1 AI-2E family transporter [Streptomyces sp. NBC_01242]WSJ36519.1 AI-2E family transporter [Streptomyces sp. NBC_01321]